ncbi:helix-turn-helix domain-containing protein [Streptomyces sp. NPDC002530]
MARGAGKFDAAILRHLRATREVDGRLLSASDLARMLGTSKARVLEYEHETSVPEAGRVAEIAQIFKVNPRELYKALPAGHVDQLKDLRSYAGLTAHDLASKIGVSRATYRDIERRAILPARHDGTVQLQIASALNLPPGMIHKALEHHPAATERRLTVARLIEDLFERATVPHRSIVVGAEDDDVLQIAAEFRRPASVVCRLLNYDLDRYRSLLKHYKTIEIELEYAQDEGEQDALRHALADLRGQVRRRPIDVASAQLRFLAEAMSGQQWRTMVDLARRNGRQYSLDEVRDPRMGYLWGGLLQRKFVTFDPGPSGLVAQITALGLANGRSRSRYYNCLYPRTHVPSMTFHRSPRLPVGRQRSATVRHSRTVVVPALRSSE